LHRHLALGLLLLLLEPELALVLLRRLLTLPSAIMATILLCSAQGCHDRAGLKWIL
jgi:hypothetical protein